MISCSADKQCGEAFSWYIDETRTAQNQNTNPCKLIYAAKIPLHKNNRKFLTVISATFPCFRAVENGFINMAHSGIGCSRSSLQNRQIPEQGLFFGFYSFSLSRFFMACRPFIKPVSGIGLFCFQGAPGSRLRALLRDEGFDGLRVRWHDAHAAGQVFDAVEGGGAVRVAA